MEDESIEPLVRCVVGWLMGDEYGVQLCRRSMDEDPLNFWVYFNLGHLYLNTGQYHRSIEMLEKFKRLTPRSSLAVNGSLLIAHTLNRNYEEASIYLDRLEDNDEMKMFFRFFMNAIQGNKGIMNDLFEKFISAYPDSYYDIAIMYTFQENYDKAFEYLERAYDAKDPSIITLPNDPLLTYIHHDPRWVPLLSKFGFSSSLIN